MLHKEHGKYMQDLEEQVMGEESRSHNYFLTTCQVILYSSPLPLKSALVASYPHPTWANTSVTSTCLATEDLPHRRTTNHYHFTHTGAQTISEAQKETPFARSCGEHAFRWNHSKGHSGRTPQPQEARNPTLGHNTQTQPCQGILLRLQHGKGGQKRILLQALLGLHLGWHSWPFRDV